MEEKKLPPLPLCSLDLQPHECLQLLGKPLLREAVASHLASLAFAADSEERKEILVDYIMSAVRFGDELGFSPHKLAVWVSINNHVLAKTIGFGFLNTQLIFVPWRFHLLETGLKQS